MLKREDISKKRFETPQNSKDLLALQKLGYRYRKGIGVPIDEKASYECFRKAAEQGLAESQAHVGYCLELGLGVAQNFKEALFFYHKAAEQGDAYALERLGRCYEKGEEVEQNMETAAAYYKKAAEQKNFTAQTKLAFIMLKNPKKPTDLDEAKSLINKSRKQGDKLAQLYWHQKIYFTPPPHTLGRPGFYPIKFPPIVDQVGPYCGSAALAGASNYAQGTHLYATRLEQKRDSSEKEAKGIVVLDKLNETTYTTQGPQYDANSFAAVAPLLGIKGGKVVILENCTEREYTHYICDAISNKHVLITAFDYSNCYPAEHQGKNTHWAFIFGWESDQYGIPFVKGTHVGVYFEAPSSKFYESNKQLPDKNPLAPGDLKKFRYSFFQIPIDKELFKKEGREIMVNGVVKQF